MMDAYFHELFEGREDAVFVDDPPRLEKLDDPNLLRPDVPLNFITSHLNGSGIGIYPLRDGNRCKWICSDFDTSEAELLAWNYAKAWEYYGIQAWVETSKSKGFHVWVFSDDWMSGTIARRAGLWVHEMADIEAVELNPKQELLEDGGYGNCVRLPYPGNAQHERQTMWDTDRTPLAIGDWLPQALRLRTPVSELHRLAAMWKAPTPAPRTPRKEGEPGREGGASDYNEHIVGVFKGHTDIKEGERDLVFHTLARHMAGMGLEIDEAHEVGREVWEEQTANKATYPYANVRTKIERAYAQRNRR